jgi:hypothetical protein
MRSSWMLPFLLSANLCFAQGAAPAPDTALRLARLMLSHNEDGTPVRPCLPEQAVFGEALKRDIARHVFEYGGITPQSQYWDEVVELNYQYRSAQCKLAAEVVEHYARSLAAKLSPAELADALAFTRSPAGRKLAQSMPDDELRKFGEARMKADTGANSVYQDGLRDLAARYKADPR